MTAGLFLDLDGTLADSHAMLAHHYHLLVAKTGRDDAPAFRSAAAWTLPQVVQHLCEGRSDLDAHALLTAYERGVAADYVTVPPREGTHALLKRARETNVPVAVVTSARKDLATGWLEAQGLMAQVALVVGRATCARTKPDPEPYRYAVNTTGCRADRSAAIEDTRSGVRAARGAGLTACAIGVLADDRVDWPQGTVFLDALTNVWDHIP